MEALAADEAVTVRDKIFAELLESTNLTDQERADEQESARIEFAFKLHDHGGAEHCTQRPGTDSPSESSSNASSSSASPSCSCSRGPKAVALPATHEQCERHQEHNKDG